LVDFAFSEEQEMLRRSAREFLAKECSPKVVRKLMESPSGYDPALWKKIADLGWTALGIPEQYGGVGTFLDLIVVLEEAGRALLPGPFFSTMGLAVPVLIEAGTEAQKKEVLTAIAPNHQAGGTQAALRSPRNKREAAGSSTAPSSSCRTRRLPITSPSWRAAVAKARRASRFSWSRAGPRE
jgi:alkylation response protein AidB-like acyl-CoA dehydrogenase